MEERVGRHGVVFLRESNALDGCTGHVGVVVDDVHRVVVVVSPRGGQAKVHPVGSARFGGSPSS